MTKSGRYSIDEREALIQLAYQTLSAYLDTHRPLEYQSEFESFQEPAAVFVTLYSKGLLRGCVGQVHADKPLYAAVQDAALSAAFADPRFPALNRSELEQLRIKIAILSPLAPIKVEDIEIGHHGLLIEHNFRRGLLLPEVASERDWDPITFLEHLCLKANLPPGTWKNADQLLGFTTEVIQMD